MSKLMQFLEGLSFVVYILGIFYVVFQYENIATIYEIPPYILIGICFIGILHVIYKYIKLFMEANRLEYEFTSIVNHTFRTPLTRIMWLSKELEKDLPQKEKLLYLQNTTNATDKLLEIVDLFVGIKNINNTSTYFFEAISVRDIVEKVIAKYREEINKKNIVFQVATFRNIPLLTLDIKKISFVVDALIENAIFYTPKEGKIWIECTTNSKRLSLSVSDNGMGLSLMDKFKIFSKFYRSKQAVLMNPDGMGLKLYLSKQIVKRHSGEIFAESGGKDRGTKVTVELPYNK